MSDINFPSDIRILSINNKSVNNFLAKNNKFQIFGFECQKF